MSTQLASAPARQEHPPQPGTVPVPEKQPVRRVGLLDRAALHLGVALVTWSRRPRRASARTRRHLTPELDEATRRELADARREQEELRDQFFALQLFR